MGVWGKSIYDAGGTQRKVQIFVQKYKYFRKIVQKKVGIEKYENTAIVRKIYGKLSFYVNKSSPFAIFWTFRCTPPIQTTVLLTILDA